MLTHLKGIAREKVRCTKHNLMDLKIFTIKHKGANWTVSDGDKFRKTFDFYPYLVFLEAEGYLKRGEWQLQPGMTVIDGGGCYGEFALYASHRVGPTGRVIMLEPDLANVAKAKEFIRATAGEMPANLEILPVGLWKTSGVLRFAAGLGAGSQLLEDGEAVPEGAHLVEVQVESLESLMKRCGLTRLDYVKLDIEGAEIEVLESAADVLKAYRPKFAIASYHMRDGQKTSVRLEQQFKALGYDSSTGFEKHHLTTWGSAK